DSFVPASGDLAVHALAEVGIGNGDRVPVLCGDPLSSTVVVASDARHSGEVAHDADAGGAEGSFERQPMPLGEVHREEGIERHALVGTEVVYPAQHLVDADTLSRGRVIRAGRSAPPPFREHTVQNLGGNAPGDCPAYRPGGRGEGALAEVDEGPSQV